MANTCKCVLKQGNEFVAFDGRREIVGEEAMVRYAKKHKMLFRCDDCMGTIADFRIGGRGWVGDLRQQRSPQLQLKRQGRETRRPRERIPVIRSLNGGEVGYRYFGESHGLKATGIDFSKLEGFRGSGRELARELKMPIYDVAKTLKVEVMEFMELEYDISKD